MTTRVADRTEEWPSRPFTDGYAGLQSLADAEFSGIVTAGRATAAFLNGTVVAILDGGIEAFEDTEGTIREAPSPALPLLMVMQDRGDEVRAKYYSEETALSAADHKLSDGGFTGFVELSENVLSGDYYVVYHGGRSMSVAFVGESAQLLTDDEAFDRADDEVGIYKVYPVDIDPVEIPEPDDGQTQAVAASGSDDGDETVADEADAEPTTEQAAVTTENPETRGDETRETGTSGGVAHREEAPVEQESGSQAPPDQSTADQRSEPDRSESTGRSREERSSTADGARSDERTRTSERSTTEESGTRRSETTERDREERSARDERADPERSTASDADTGRRSSEDRPARDEQPETGRPGSSRRTETDRSEGDRRSETDRPEGDRRSETDRSEGDRRSETDRPESGRRSETDHTDSGGRGRDSRSREADDTRARSGRTEDHRSESRRGERDPAPRTEDTTDRRTETAATQQDQQSDPDPLAEGESGGLGEPGELERKSIPSVDPGRTWNGDESGPDAGTTFASPAQQSEARAEPVDSGPAEPRNGASDTGGAPSQQSGGSEAVRELEREIDVLEEDIDALEREREELVAENDELAAENEQLTAELQSVEAEREELRSEVQRLESKVADLESQLAEGGSAATPVDASVELSRQEAIDGTNLFVRYGSKGDATLEAAHDGRADREAVEANLELECHTRFESDDAAVAGQPFDEFLESTIQYRFVHWVVHDLLYEISETGHDAALQDLYDALPRLDRAELNGSASVVYTEDGEEHRSQEPFDIVLRDRMGNPLAVANINDSRDAATDDMMTSLVTAASRVGETSDTLAGAFQVTASFFDPDALETAAEATGGGLLSRDKRESFVRLSRKQGYHLCLVEAREDKFHLAVPEL